MIQQDFDIAAINYDEEFTHSGIGIAQRNQVWSHLNLVIKNGQTCLELNCGTGEDALLLSQKELKVIATDISPEMVNITQHKLRNHSQSQSHILDINELDETLLKEVNVVFSNFGGLNCISPKEWEMFGQKLHEYLPEAAHVIFIIMSKKCLWERIYFALKGNKKWNRNTIEPVEAHVSGNYVKTWYYSPEDIKQTFSGKLDFVKQRPIGFFVPPSYLESFFTRKKGFLKLLVFADKLVKSFSSLSNYADHFYIEFKKVKHG